MMEDKEIGGGGMSDCKIIDASRYIKYTPPFSNIGRRGKPTTVVSDANGLLVCSAFNGLGFTLNELREHARLIADALNKQHTKIEGGAE